MSGQFKRFKNKYILEAAIKSVVVGVSFGMFAAGVILLALKLCNIEINPAYYALIAIGGALICGGLAFLILKPCDKKIAKRLDEEYGLGERVQTALAFKDRDGGLVSLQRQDAETRLSDVKYKAPKISRIWQYILVFALALIMLVTAIAVPAKSNAATPGQPDEPPVTNNKFELSDYQTAALEELIADVEDSHLSEKLKSDIALSLEALLRELKEEDTVNGMRETVAGCVHDADGLIKGACSYYGIGSALYEADSKQLARIIAYGAEFYKRYNFTSYVNVTDFYVGCVETAETEISATSEELKQNIAGLVIGEMRSELTAFIFKINSTLSGFAEQDNLYSILSRFAAALSSEELTAGSINNIFDNLTYSLSNELAAQAYKFALDRYICNKLVALFEIPSNLVNISAWDLTSVVNEDSGGGDDDKTNGGGYGDGDQIYGSDDEIYDPVTGEYVKYGEILQRYYDIVNSFLNEGVLTDEQAAIVRTYFTLLFGGLKDEK